MLGWTNLAFTRLYHQVTLRQPPSLPKIGPAILLSNHTSGLDPLLIQSCCTRLIHWMMAREYYEQPRMKWIFKTIDAIPVERSGRDLSSTRTALRVLHDGKILGIFPEGKIPPTRELLPFQSGVALLAIKAKVPVYPVYLDGTQRGKEMGEAFAWPNRATVTFGPPIDFDRSSTNKNALIAVAEKFRNEINILASTVRKHRMG